MRLLIAGRPGSGKTTLLLSVLKRFPNRFSGFYTEEVRESGRRTGFTVTSVGTEETVLFASVSFPRNHYAVSKYGVDVKAFERIALKEMEEAIKNNSPLLIDEIGKMELLSDGFCRLLKECLSMPLPVVATVHSHPHPITDSLKRRKDIELITLERSQYEDTLKYVAERIVKGIYNCPVEPVGVLRTPFKCIGDVPKQGEEAKGSVVVYDEYADALSGIETVPRLVLIWWMDKAEHSLVGRERGIGGRKGVFALRSPNRPNPIGLTTVELLSRRKNVLEVVGLDALDGSLVLDIKPQLKEKR